MSPILIIIVAITGIASFAITDFSFGFHLRFFRFIFVLLGYIAGFLGISIGMFVYVSVICNEVLILIRDFLKVFIFVRKGFHMGSLSLPLLD